MIEEFDMVISNKCLRVVPRGTAGTVLHIYKPETAFEVGFMDENGSVLDVLTVYRDDIEKLQSLLNRMENYNLLAIRQ